MFYTSPIGKIYEEPNNGGNAMQSGRFQKQKILFLKELFEVETDENHGFTMGEILSYLESKGIKAERKSIYDDIDNLKEHGMDIVAKKSSTTKYMLQGGLFQIAELKLLVDAVSASRFVTRKKSLELIGKLERLTSNHHAKELHRQVFVDKRIKSMNESIYYSVDVIHAAIADNIQLAFRYFSYSRERTKIMRRDGLNYQVSPLALLYKDENYYLAAWSDDHNSIVNYRVDRMMNVKAVDIPRVQNDYTLAFDPAEHLKSQFSMFSGELEKVEIVFSNSLATVVIDRFGSDILMVAVDENHFLITIDVEISPTFLSWIFMLQNNAIIVSPKHVVKQYTDMVKSILESYS